MALATGTRVGSYEILAPIGAGGMGEVYRARDSKLKRDVALKILPDSFAQDPDRMARFQREAEVLASLNHPNIAAIYGVEERALVMELVEGEELKGPLPLDKVFSYASQIASALEAAHEKGIVHRDLKPGNIKVTPSGVVKVLDFGLAAVALDSASTPANSPTLTLRATQAGLIMGTAGYMSPEQAAGKPVDRRADIWSFGVVVWEMLTGKKLFDGETVSHTLAAVLTKDPDWTQLPAGTPANLRRLLHRCLERDLNRRLHDIGDAWIELNTQDEPAPAAPAAKSSGVSRWLPWVAAAVVAAAGVSWGLLHSPPAQPRPVVRWSFTQENPFGMPAISRDGTQMAYSEFSAGAIRIVLRKLDQVEGKPIAGTETGGMPVFSPDGRWIAYFSGFTGGNMGTKLKKIAVAGGAPVSLCDCPGAVGTSWGDDGSIVYSDGKSLWRVPEAGGTPQTLTTPDQKKGEAAHLFPSFLPGAQAIVFVVSGKNFSHIAILDLKKGGYRVIVNDGTNPQYVNAGYLTYVRGGALLAAPFDAKRLTVTGSETPVIDAIAAIAGSGIGEYSVSDNGLLVYMAGVDQGGKSLLGWVDRKGATQAISEPQRWGTGRLSPDALRVANSVNTGGTSVDIWVFDVERRTLTRLTFGGNNSDPVWTPDGRHIAYYSTGSGTSGIYWVPADGSGKPELLATTEFAAVPSSWTPDGKTLLFSQRGADKISHIWLLPVAGEAAQRKPTLLHDTSFSEGSAEISPDGRFVAYSSLESGATEIYVQPFPGPGAKVRISTQGGSAPRWSHNGRELFYWLPGRNALLAVDTQTTPVFRAGLPQELFKMFSGTTWDVAPDGKHFLVELFASGSTLRLETVVNWFDELRRRVPQGK